MSWVLPEILCTVNDVSLAAKVVDPMRDALCVNILLGTCSEVFVLLEAERILDAVFEHLTGLLTQHWVLLMVRLKVLLPGVFQKRGHLKDFDNISL